MWKKGTKKADRKDAEKKAEGKTVFETPETKNKNLFTQVIQKIRAHKPTFYSIIAFIAILAILSGTKFYLYFNFILGNDIIIKLSTENENLNMLRGEQKNLTFEAKVTTNLFCEAVCESEFEDISSGQTIKKESFTLKPGQPLELVYPIAVSEFGEGQKLFRQSLVCKAQSTTTCHTSGQETSRNILVTVEYALSDEEKRLKENLKADMESLKNNLSTSFGKTVSSISIINSLDDILSLDGLKIQSGISLGMLQKNNETLKILKETWDRQDFTLLDSQVQEFKDGLKETEETAASLYNSSIALVNQYGELLTNMHTARNTIYDLRLKTYENLADIDSISAAINDFNTVLTVLKQKDTIENKKKYAAKISDDALILSAQINTSVNFDAMKKAIGADIEYRLLCMINQTCIPRPKITDRINQESFDIAASCRDISALNQLYKSLSDVPAQEPVDNSGKGNNNNNLSNASAVNETAVNASQEISKLRQYIVNGYLGNITDGKNTDSIRAILLSEIFSQVGIPNGSLIPSIVEELKKKQLQECRFFTVSGIPDEIDINVPDISAVSNPDINISFNNISASCCVFGKCRECCTSEECISNPKTYPVVFLHGHSFNEDVSAEYSLDAFNLIQRSLEADGYLNAGTISEYTSQDIKPGLLGLSGVPVSLKASYYFDIFKEPSNYVVVQTKSENIDTYSIRLNDLIKTIKYRTGKDKIIIISHSMGGLVARRYIQIFGGADIEKLIMIGAPNSGVKGNIADYCSIIGENLECRDLNSGSLFINKVNRERVPQNIGVYNIIGEGCDMDGGDGDGVVLKENAKLDYAKNIYVNGTCSGIAVLHTEMLNVEKYPQVYDAIREALDYKLKN